MVNCEIIRLIKTESVANGEKLVQFYKVGAELELVATTHISTPATKRSLSSTSTTIRAVKITIKSPSKVQVHYREILKDGKTRGLLNEVKETMPEKPKRVPQAQQAAAPSQPKNKPVPRRAQQRRVEFSDEPKIIDQTEETIAITDHRF